MSAILERLKADFAGRKNQRIEVPELSLVAYFDPLTADDRRQIIKATGGGDEGLMIVNLLIRKLKDEDGKPVFANDATTRKALIHECDIEVLSKIARMMGTEKAHEDLVEEAKNS